MIKAEEMMIGNKVFSDTERDNPVVTILELLGAYANVSYKDLPCDVAKQSTPYDRLHPIPLTPEIFKKCVFAEGFPIVTCSGTINGVPVGPDSYMMQIDDEHIRPVYYLHDLQNIHHALMEKELKIDL